MRKPRVALIAVAVLAAAVACGDPEVVEQPDDTGTRETTEERAPGEDATGESTPEQPKAAQVGNSLTLEGTDDRVQVTVVKFVDPAAPGNEYSSPEPGSRFVAVQFRLENVGTTTYDDSPSNGATLADNKGQRFSPTFAETAAGPSFPGGVTVAPGDTALGFIAFEVPEDSTIAKVQFALDSGFADQVGQWEVPQ
ncbi:DUF4352 domain-containing protein [Streptomyces sp. JJ38]|uniref:DUF4352 domain-containing protein n=1 Tax=Streptomyces sp. JJ38 TaxID=2738128 RepID=UPI001C56775C|nr:DUF4352 domain-containing protein [Streptomyces sp. JJ38]MBW1599718.1 DUF4352 domain-containing protein [Streptomyces sp. JJ38]